MFTLAEMQRPPSSTLRHADFFSGVVNGMIFPHCSGAFHFPCGFRNFSGT
jgi:hypothetical protein